MMVNGFFDNLLTDPGATLATAMSQTRRKLRDAFSLARYFNASTQSCLQEAAQLAYDTGRSEVDTEHALYAILGSEIVQSLLKKNGVAASDMRAFLESNYFAVIVGTKISFEQMTVSSTLKRMIESAFTIAKEFGHTYIGPEHLLIAFASDETFAAGRVIAKFGLEEQVLRRQTLDLIGRGPIKSSRTPRLDRFSRDLTSLAQQGKLDPVIGRQKEIETTIEILARRKKNNPVLIGEPGVGKTAIVEGLAQRIASEMVPNILRNRRVVELSLNSLVAGSQFRGQFEERVKLILDELLRRPDEVILFIDELHTLVGAGSSAEGTLDAANIIKPALARGELHLIGATTLNEYKNHIEKDAALERRFQPVYVSESSIRESIEILSGLRPHFESHHKVAITDPAIAAAAQLSDRYMVNRFLPDKAIDLLDQAAARVRIRERSSTPSVNPSDIAEVLASLTGIPITELSSDERERLLQFECMLRTRVFGQDAAIVRISDAVRVARSGLRTHHRPLAAFFFVGPSGVGKTEMARALAEQLFGSEDSIIQLDMSQFSEPQSVARLIGAPPGYIGYDEGGQLTERVRQRPYSVVVLDQIDKGHRDAHNIIMQALDQGRITDSRGRVIDFSNTIMIATANLPDELIAELHQSTNGYEHRTARVRDILSRQFSGEFLDHIDDVVLFSTLGREQLQSIAELSLRQIQQNAAQNGVKVSFDETVINHLIDSSDHEKNGARDLRRTIRREIEAALAKAMIATTAADAQFQFSYDENSKQIRVQGM